MDAAGLQTAHVVGNSLGGWVALELAQRGRARSVVALAPAGGWERGSREERRLKALFTRNHMTTTRLLPYLPRLVPRPRLRRLLLAQALAHGDRLDPASAYWIVRDSVECPAYFELMEAILRDGPPMGFERIECPVLIAWGTKDRVLPRRRYSPRRPRQRCCCLLQSLVRQRSPCTDNKRSCRSEPSSMKTRFHSRAKYSNRRRSAAPNLIWSIWAI